MISENPKGGVYEEQTQSDRLPDLVEPGTSSAAQALLPC